MTEMNPVSDSTQSFIDTQQLVLEPPENRIVISNQAQPSGFFGWLNTFSPQTVFVLVAGFFGLAMLLITPPVQAPDEPHHWYRIYQLTQGKMLAPRFGADVPRSMLAYQEGPGPALKYVAMAYRPTVKTSLREILDRLKEPLNPRDTRFRPFPDTTIYPLLPYLPQTITMFIARKLHWPALGLMYAGRMGTLLGYLLIGWSAIRITPILKWPAAMILTSPVALFLAGSLSEDPMTTSLVFLATAIALRCILSPVRLTTGVILLLGLVMMAVALCKSAYFPVVFLVLAIPLANWGTGHRRWAIPVSMIVLSVATFAVWSRLIDASHVKLHGDGPGVQMPWILHHPMAYVTVLRTTVTQYTSVMLFSSVGTLGWWDTLLHPGPVYFIFFSLIWVNLAYDQPVGLRPIPRLLAGFAVIASIGLVVTACYLYACPLAYPVVAGLQGRYFIPLGLMICMLFRRRGRYIPQPKWMLLMMSGIALYTVWVEIERYYLPEGYLWQKLSGG